MGEADFWVDFVALVVDEMVFWAGVMALALREMVFWGWGEVNLLAKFLMLIVKCGQ